MPRSTLVPLQIPATATPEGVSLARALIQTLEPIMRKEILDGILLPQISLIAGSVSHVSHKLTRPVVGYLVVKKNANSVIWDSEASNDRKDIFLDLNCSADCLVSLWVF